MMHKIQTLTDDELVPLARNRQPDAFAELIRRYQSVCMRQALSILRDKAEAEDQVQTAYWKAYRGIDKFHGDSKFSTWLMRIIVNQCLMRLRQIRPSRMVYLDDGQIGDETATLELPSTQLNPEAEAGQKQIRSLLDREIRRIPPLLRQVFLLREVEQLPMPDVATRLGISLSAAKSRLLRARLELRERLSRYQGRMGMASLVAS